MSRHAPGLAPRPLLLAALTETTLPELTLPQWQTLLSQARRCKLGGRLAVLAAERGWLPALPMGVRVQLHNLARVVERKHLDTVWEGDRLLAALHGLQMPVVLLKGAAYVMAGLPAARGREFSDVDILVPRERLREVELALLANGWVAKALDPYDERYYRHWMHELPPLQHVERMTVLDVHHTLTPPTSRFAIDITRVLPQCRPLPDWPGLAVLAPADRVLHSAVHLMQEGDFGSGLRDLVDLTELICHEAGDAGDTGFWPLLVARARELGLALPLHDALRLAQDLLGLAVPPAALAELAAAAGAGPVRRLVVALLRRALLQPLQPRAGDGLVALVLYMRSHWLRMPWYLLAPHLLRKAWMRLRRQSDGDTQAADRGLLARP